LPPSAAEFYIAAAVDSLILLRKINESTAAANDYLARSTDVRLKRILCRRRRLTSKTASFPNYFLARSAKK
jgi:hypothetical protein